MKITKTDIHEKLSTKLESAIVAERSDCMEDIFVKEGADVILDESTGEQYYTEICEDTLEERKIIIKINSKGQRIKKIRCPKGRIAKSVNGRIVCVTPTGRERLTKKLAIKRTVRTKKAKGQGWQARVNFRRQRALRKRRQMGLGKQ